MYAVKMWTNRTCRPDTYYNIGRLPMEHRHTSSRPDITHGMPSAFKLPTATRPATVAEAPDITTTRTRPADFRTRPRFAALLHDPTETKNARQDGTAAPGQRSNFHTATAATGSTLHGPIRPRFTHTTATTSAALIDSHTAQKSPHTGVSGVGLFIYSVTSFTISSAVFPSLAFRNFALASPRFTSGMCFSASWSNLASPGVNLFNRSKIAKP